MRLGNDTRTDLDEVEAEALVDTEAIHLCIPEHVALQLQLKYAGVREVALADGQVKKVRYFSPVRIDLLNRIGSPVPLCSETKFSLE